MGDNSTPDLTPFFPETKPEDIPVLIPPGPLSSKLIDLKSITNNR
jgi:hypothetical protein